MAIMKSEAIGPGRTRVPNSACGSLALEQQAPGGPCRSRKRQTRCGGSFNHQTELAIMKAKPSVKPGPGILELEESDDALDQRTKAPVKLQKILVPTDFSDCSMHALEYALSMAELFRARLILLHVVEPAVCPENYMAVSPGFDDTNQSLMETARERLDTICRKRIGGRISSETLVRMGHAYSEIGDTAKAMGADLIVIATHGFTGLKQVLLGSTTERVIRHAPCPVLTVPHPQQT